VTPEELAPVLHRHYLELIEIPIDEDEWRRRAFYDAERCLAVAGLAAGYRPERILEVGVGYLGIVAAIRATLGASVEVAGLEHPGRTFLDEPAFRRDMVELGVDLRTCDLVADPIPFPPGGFDVVVLSEVIEHLAPSSVPHVLVALREQLAPGGALIVSSPNLSALYRILSVAFGNGHIMDVPVDQTQHPGVYGHQRIYGRWDIEQLAAVAGMRVDRWEWLEWDRGFIERSSLRGRLLVVAQRVGSKLVDRWACNWACALQKT
jgi:2-polyprenyl-3-methyl-5-hydroxy-6-metoxy-1,4-benzoquinol methylase